MTKPLGKTRYAKVRFTLGRKNFAKISAVEGIRLSADMEQQFREFDRQGISDVDRRNAISRAFAKSG
ncbi:hypothetical protein [Phenylobacterium sp.]|uniref:hypothetical protein n=1 Tax=Phenylobacterium sp. TaxID=1871053 RepID=UPI00286E5FBD|nr:hypothetical protein [Phenylobacterium sp.]